jgi:hypothetical protein
MCDGSGHLGFQGVWMKLLVGLLCISLAACDAVRPAGVYTPEAGSAPPDTSNDFEPDPELDPEVDAGPGPGEDDGASEDEPDDGVVPVDEPDAVVSPDSPFRKFEGRYLMRIDLYSTAQATEGSDTLIVHNRVSNLMLTTLSDDNGRLVSKEQLCFQTYQHECVKGCTKWTTSLDNTLPKVFQQKPAVERVYQVEDNRLVAPMAYQTLGFDASGEPTIATALPTLPTDPSVWKLDEAGSKAGLRTNLVATLKSSTGLTSGLNCVVSTVQRLGTGFTVDDLSQANPLVGKDIPLQTDGSALKTIDADDNGSSTLTASFCKLEEFKKRENEAGGEETNVVRFMKTDSPNCPTSAAEYETMFKVPGPSANP